MVTMKCWPISTVSIFTVAINIIMLFELVQTSNSNLPPTKLKVAVYYETLSPESQKLFVNQLYPTLAANDWHLYDAIDLSLIPFGVAKYRYDNTQSKFVFSCHNGPEQCQRNLYHACVVNSSGSRTDKVAFQYVYELLQNASATHPNAGIATNITTCQSSGSDAIHLANYGTQTDSVRPPLQSIPAIVFDDNYSDEESTAALNDFRQVLSTKMVNDPSYQVANKNNHMPNSCSKVNLNVVVAIVFALLGLIIKI